MVIEDGIKMSNICMYMHICSGFRVNFFKTIKSGPNGFMSVALKPFELLTYKFVTFYIYRFSKINEISRKCQVLKISVQILLPYSGNFMYDIH